MPGRLFPIIIATQDHIFYGSVATGGSRIYELLSSEGSDYLLLKDVRVHQRNRPNRPVHLAECLIYKSELLFAIPTVDKHESPAKRWNAFVEKRRVVAFLTLPGFSIAGCLHLPGSVDLVSIATLQLKCFVPVANAAISSVGDDGLPHEVPAVIVNKRFMSSFAVHEGEAPTRPAVETTTFSSSTMQRQETESAPA